MALVDRHVAFVEALRAAGCPVSLSEGLDGVRALDALGLADREVLRGGLAATLVKRQEHRATFDALFDLYFPARLGRGWAAWNELDEPAGSAPSAVAAVEAVAGPAGDVEALREQLVQALLGADQQRLDALVVQGVEQYGALGRRGSGGGPPTASWSAYNTMREVDPAGLVVRLAQALADGGSDSAPRSPELARLAATRRVDDLRARVETEVRRRVAEEKTPEEVARTAVRPAIDRIDFTSARRAEIDEMRRQIYPLARRLATRLAKEHHARRRGPLDFRRTVRASVSTGGVPLTTHHRPKRPHRTELVVLCDVSGSVAGFASFTLLLVFALREQFAKVRAFTFVDDVHEVTDDIRPGADSADVLARLAESARQASQWGRTDYGRALRRFAERHGDALTPRSSLVVLGDARSNYTDPAVDTLRSLAAVARHAWWLNPEHPRQWGTGDSAAPEYAEVVRMVECRNLAQLGELVHDLV